VFRSLFTGFEKATLGIPREIYTLYKIFFVVIELLVPVGQSRCVYVGQW